MWYTEDEHVERVENDEEYGVAGEMFAQRKRGKNVAPAEMLGRDFVYFKTKKTEQKK